MSPSHSHGMFDHDMFDYDAAVIGAGPAGSSMAAALAASGWQVLLIERERFPRHKVCGEFLSPEAQHTLSSLGLGQALTSFQPVSLSHAELVSRRGTRLLTPMPAPGWGLSRLAMDARLADSAVQQGATMWQGSTVVDVRAKEGKATVTVRRENGTDNVRVRTAIMAGGRAVSSKLLDHPAKRETDRLNVGIKAHYADVTMPNRVEVYLFDGGYVGINPIETGNANVCLLASYAAFAAADRDPSRLFDRIAVQNPAFGDRLSGARMLTQSLCSVGAVDTGRPSRPWNGMAVLGDTATMIPPLCGDGMAMALHSAALCLPYANAYLRNEIDQTVWQSRYVADWHAAFDHRLRMGRLLQAMLTSRGADRLLRLGGRLPAVANYFVRATRGGTLSMTDASLLTSTVDG